MTVAAVTGLTMVMPLRRLAPVPRLAEPAEQVDDGLVAWAAHVREADEACLLVDGRSQVVAMSAYCGVMLDLDPAATVGAPLLDVMVLVDFSATGVPISDAAPYAPPLRALASGGMARGLVRLRRRDRLRTYDVVGVPLAGGAGALAFLNEI